MKNSLLIIVSVLFAGCVTNRQSTSTVTNEYITTASGFQYKILHKGTGDSAKAGQQVMIFETTTYLNGTVLYSNENNSNPVKVLLGANQATDAVDEEIRGMQVGEIRQLIVPPLTIHIIL